VVKKQSWLPLIILSLTISGFFWRFQWWPDYVTFGYEQARDGLASQKIFFQKKLTLIGPTTEIEGLFHGPLYYYLIGLPYFLFGKNPASVSFLHLLINLTTIPIIFLVGRSLFNSRVGILAAFLFAISYEVCSYSLWLSNPSPGLPLIILAYFFFYQAFRKNHQYLPLAAFLLGLATHFDLIIIMGIFAALALFFVYNTKPLPRRTLFFSLAAFLLPLANYPLFEIRHDFLMTRKFFDVLTHQDAQFRSIFEYFGAYFNGLAREFANVLFPIHGFFAGLLMFILLFYLCKKMQRPKSSQTPWPLISIWLFSTLPVFLVAAAVTNSEFSFFGVDAAIVLLIAALLDEWLKKKKRLFAFFIIIIIFLGNLRAWNNYFPDPMKKLFDAQRGVILKDTLATLDYTYHQASGQPFRVETLTVPLYISPLWDYLYSWYGQEKFGYLPSKDESVPLQFLIIEPGWGQTYEIFKQKTIDHLNQKTELETSKDFGLIIVEKRRLLPAQ
jgi:4-amino-4-deoxy-L-arabinose transferase-like glycosyltransferase